MKKFNLYTDERDPKTYLGTVLGENCVYDAKQERYIIYNAMGSMIFYFDANKIDIVTGE